MQLTGFAVFTGNEISYRVEPHDETKFCSFVYFSSIKIVCTGLTQNCLVFCSQVIRGLVFNKKPAHKHMQTTYKNPRLLLFCGGLGDPEGGLSSLNSIEHVGC